MSDINESIKKIESLCPYCGTGCGIIIEVQNKRMIKVSGNKNHPTNFGRLCTKGSTCIEPVVNDDRLSFAKRREERNLEAINIPIKQAIKQTANGLREIIDEYGPDAVSMYVSGQMSMEAQYLANKLIKGFIGTNNIESNSRLCMASAGSGYKLSLGAQGAYFYVCGEDNVKAKDIDEALKQVIKIHGNMSDDEAKNYFTTMTKDKRYIRDIY